MKGSFEKAANTYEEVAYIQKEIAQALIVKLVNFVEDEHQDVGSILDLGAGTGFASIEAMKYFKNAKLTLNDLAPSMLSIAKNNLLDINANYIQSDFQNHDFDFHDLIISNLSLQWVDDLKKQLQKSWDNTNILAITTLLDKNFSEFEQILQKADIESKFLPNYPTYEQIIQIINELDPYRFQVEIKSYKVDFNNLKAFLNYIKKMGATLNKEYINHTNLKKLLSLKNEKFSITYQVIFILMKR